MYEVKNRIFLELSKTQKSALCNFLRALVKKSPDIQIDDILNKFIEDEKYYLEINSSRFEFLADFIDDEKFISDAKLYITECKKYYDYKKSQAPLIQAQKEFDRKKRKFLQEVKMSKEKPTQKQLYYYKNLCKKYNIEQKTENESGEELSRLNLRDLIDGILNEHKTN
jgi:hypothetical protein